MEKLKYYRLDSSNDEKEIGDIYAQTIYQIRDFVDSKKNTQKRFEIYSDISGHINEELDLTKFEAMNQAKMTDLMYSRFFWHKCFYSPKFIKLSENFILENAKIIPCKIHHNGKIHDYFLMQLLRTLSIVDFDNSEFAIFDDIKGTLKNVYTKKVTADTHLDILRKIAKDSDYELTIKPTKIVLNKHSDLFYLKLDNTFYISERFKKAIEKEGLTGFEFTERPLKAAFYGNW